MSNHRSAWFGAVADEADVIDNELSGLEASFGRDVAFSDAPVASVNMQALSDCFKPDMIQAAQQVLLEQVVGVDASEIPDWFSNVATSAIEMTPGFMILALFNPLELATEEPRDIAKALVTAPGFAQWPTLDTEAKTLILEDVLVSQIGAMDQTVNAMQQLLASEGWLEAVKAGPMVALEFLGDIPEVAASILPTSDEQNFNKLAYAYVVWHLVGSAIREAASMVDWDAESDEADGQGEAFAFAQLFDTYPELIQEIDAVVASDFRVLTMDGAEVVDTTATVVPMAPPDLFPIEEVAPAGAPGMARPATVLGVGYGLIAAGAALKVF